MIPERKIIAKLAKTVFYEEVNDIDIYIEDTSHGYEKLFSILFSRVFEGKYRVQKVFPLGGRVPVTDAHKAHNNIGRPVLFVVDGDLHLLSGDTVACGAGLFKVPCYCIENILCDPKAIHEILYEEDSVSARDEIINNFGFDDWLRKNENILFELFVEYAVSFIINPTQQTVAFSVNKLVSSNDGILDVLKVNNRIESIKLASILSSDQSRYDSVRECILNNFLAQSLLKFDVISGKDYLFPLLKVRMRATVKTKAPDINLKLRLAKMCDIIKLKSAEQYIV